MTIGALVAASASAVAAALLGLPWLWAVTAACLVAATAAVVVPRRHLSSPDRAATAGPAAGPTAGSTAGPVPAPAVHDIDDLPAFFTHPPGAPAPSTPVGAAPVTTADPGTVGPAADEPSPVERSAVGLAAAVPADGEPPPGPAVDDGSPPSHRASLLVAGAAVAVLGVVVSAVVVTTGGDDDPPATRAAPSAGGDTTPPRTTTPADSVQTPATSAPAPLTATAAGGLAGTDLAPGADGFTATASFTGVVLEPRAVGVTVVYPELRVSSDGRSTVVHLDMPVWNCLGTEPPSEPAAAQCVRSLEEFADLGSPELVVQRTGDRLDLTGTFATYTRPNGSAPAYTGRSYELTVQLAPSGTGAAGTLTLGGATVGSSGPGSFSG